MSNQRVESFRREVDDIVDRFIELSKAQKVDEAAHILRVDSGAQQALSSMAQLIAILAARSYK